MSVPAAKHAAPTNSEQRPYTEDRIPDDDLLAIATTCSNKQMSLRAEMALRRRYPSRKTPSALRRALGEDSK